MEKQVDISRLIMEFSNRTISDSNLLLLREWVNKSEENHELFKNLTQLADVKQRVAFWEIAAGEKEKAWQTLLDRREKSNLPVRRLIPVRRYWQVAAAVLVIFVGVAIFFKHSLPSGKKLIPDVESPVASHDVLPGGEKAVLKLANGNVITLDSADSGILTKQGNLDIVKGDGSISYEGIDNTDQEVLYNTLVVPKGGQYRLLLKDGTKVWLNSASSIRYPTSFTPGEERTVEITGEIYFEVAKVTDDKGKVPFVVNTSNGVRVEVLGTHFNINAYDDEGAIRTTLLEGKVKVSQSKLGKSSSVILQPGEQALAKINSRLEVRNDIDMQQVMAWKNGKFYFDNADLASVMRQLSRWYNVEIVYEGKIPAFKIHGGANRSLTLVNLLAKFANTNIKCKVEGNKLIIPEQ